MNNSTIELQRIASQLNGKRTASGSYQCRCPAHDDNSPSLSLSSGANGKLLFKCHAGCTQNSVFAALKSKGLLGIGESASRQTSEYIYFDIDGNPALKVIRKDRDDGSKQIFQNHFNNGSWLTGGYKGELRLYKFEKWNEIFDRRLFLVEGEGCVQALEREGFIATTSAGGSKAWKSHYANQLKGRNVIILPDNDNPGFHYAACAYSDIIKVAKSVQVLELPDLKDKQDVVDWFEAGQSASELKELCKSAAELSPRFKTALEGLAAPFSTNFELPNATAKPINQWPEIRRLPKPEERLPRLREGDLNMILPPLLLRWVTDIAKRLTVGPEFVATVTFGVLGGIIGRRVAVRPMQLNNWVNHPCCLWSCISAQPGSKKSPILNEVKRLVDALENEASEEFEEQAKSAAPKLQIIALKRKHIEKEISLAIQSGDNAQIAKLQIELTALNQEAAEATPIQKRFITSDSTGAKLIEIMANNPGGITIFRDELEGLNQSFEQMGNEGLRALYLEAWAGTGSQTQDRVGVGTRRAKNVAATLIGSTQPDKLASMVSKSDDGFIQRFGLLVCMPESSAEDEDAAPDVECFERLRQFCQLASKINQESGKTLELPLSESARELFKAWRKSNSEIIRRPDTSTALKSHLAKYPSLFCALAGVIQMVMEFEKSGSLTSITEVNADAAAMAAEWIDSVYLPHARFVYEQNMAISAAQKLSQRIHAGMINDGITVRALERNKWEGLKSKATVRDGLEELQDLGWLRIAHEQGPTGRPSEKIRLNPNLKRGVASA